MQRGHHQCKAWPGTEGTGVIKPKAGGMGGKIELAGAPVIPQLTDHSRWAFPWNAPREKYLLSTASRFSQACPITNVWDCTHTFFSGENLLSESSYFHFAVGTERASLLRGPEKEVIRSEQMPNIFSSMHRQDQTLTSQTLQPLSQPSECHPLAVSDQLNVLQGLCICHPAPLLAALHGLIT